MDILLILFGWLLGLLSPALVSSIKDARDNKKFFEAIKLELSEIQFVISIAGFSLGEKYGEINKEYLEKTRQVLCRKKQPEKVVSIIKFIDMLLPLSSDELKQVVASMRPSKNTSVGLKKYSTALIDSNSMQLSKLPEEIQSKIYQLKNILYIYNQEVDWTREHFKLTFDSSLTSVNHQNVCSDLHARYADLQKICVRISEKIQEVIDCRL